MIELSMSEKKLMRKLFRFFNCKAGVAFYMAKKIRLEMSESHKKYINEYFKT